MTQIERIRQMSTEELARWLMDEVEQGQFSSNVCNAGICSNARAIAEAEEEDENAFDVAEHEREERYERLEEANERAYDLRLDFIRNISESEAKKHLPTAITLLASVCCFHNYEDDLKEILGFEDEEDDAVEGKTRTVIEKFPCRTAVQLGYIAIFGLSSGNQTYNWRGEYIKSTSINRIYDYLLGLGYEPSDEEQALLDGTSELYLKEDA